MVGEGGRDWFARRAGVASEAVWGDGQSIRPEGVDSSSNNRKLTPGISQYSGRGTQLNSRSEQDMRHTPLCWKGGTCRGHATVEDNWCRTRRQVEGEMWERCSSYGSFIVADLCDCPFTYISKAE